MRISFDLDDTIICYQECVPREPPLRWYCRLVAGDEPLRLGARDLMHSLRARGLAAPPKANTDLKNGARTE